jgi:ligand-binding sensor domain-containing protein
MTKFSKIVFFIFIFLALPIIFSEQTFSQRITGTNPIYQEGDWISYTQCRYVNSIQVAPTLVYIATEGGILRYDFYANEWLFPFTISNGLPDNYILAVALDVATNLLWCSTQDAISVYDDGSRLWRNFYLDDLGISTNDPVLSFGFEDFGVWLETRSGSHYFSPRHEFDFYYKSEKPGKSVVWFGARGFNPTKLDFYFLPNSLMFVDNGSGFFIQDSELRSFDLSYYQIDPWQKIWVGTSGLGLFSADTRIRQMAPLPFGLLNADVRAIAMQGTEIWTGGIQQNSEISGLTNWNVKNDDWTYFEPRYISRFRSDQIQDIKTIGNSAWFATTDGLTRFETERNQWYTYTVFDGLQDNLIYTVTGKDSTVWIGTNDGLDELNFFPSNNDSLEIVPLTKPKDKVAVYDVYIDGNLVWAGTNYGLFVFDKNKNEGGYYHGANGPDTEPVVAVNRLGDSLWVATIHSIEVFDLKEKLWRGGPARRFFSDTNIIDLVASKTAIWVGTEDGLYKHHVTKGYWKQFTMLDGLPDLRVQKLLVNGDYLWIGTPQGLTRFYWNSPYRID